MATSGTFLNISKKCARHHCLFMKTGTHENKEGLPHNSQCPATISLKVKVATIRQN